MILIDVNIIGFFFLEGGGGGRGGIYQILNTTQKINL